MFRAVYPTRAKKFCTCRIAWRIVIIYIIIFTLSLSFYLLPYMKEDDEGYCTSISNPIFHDWITSIWPPIRTVLVCILPVSIMIITNILLWRRIRASKRRVAPRTSNLYYSANTEKMLIFITIANVLSFIITQIPFHIYATVVRYEESIYYMRTAMLLWSSLYFGIGFYIYCLTSPYFRSKFILTMYSILKREEPINHIRRNTILQQ